MCNGEGNTVKCRENPPGGWVFFPPMFVETGLTKKTPHPVIVNSLSVIKKKNG